MTTENFKRIKELKEYRQGVEREYKNGHMHVNLYSTIIYQTSQEIKKLGGSI